MRNRRLRNNEVCKISTGSILGDAILEFVSGSQQPLTIEEYQDGEYLDGIVAQDPAPRYGVGNDRVGYAQHIGRRRATSAGVDPKAPGIASARSRRA